MEAMGNFKNSIFLLGGHDLEMMEIRDITIRI
jgi:hypothetical protein